jgi:hypothetical protein
MCPDYTEEQLKEMERLHRLDTPCKSEDYPVEEVHPLQKRIDRRYQMQKDTQQRLKMRGRR